MGAYELFESTNRSLFVTYRLHGHARPRCRFAERFEAARLANAQALDLSPDMPREGVAVLLQLLQVSSRHGRSGARVAGGILYYATCYLRC